MAVVLLFADFQTESGIQARFRCCRNAPGDGGSLLVSELNFLYKKYRVSTKLSVIFLDVFF